MCVKNGGMREIRVWGGTETHCIDITEENSVKEKLFLAKARLTDVE